MPGIPHYNAVGQGGEHRHRPGLCQRRGAGKSAAFGCCRAGGELRRTDAAAGAVSAHAQAAHCVAPRPFEQRRKRADTGAADDKRLQKIYAVPYQSGEQHPGARAGKRARGAAAGGACAGRGLHGAGGAPP